MTYSRKIHVALLVALPIVLCGVMGFGLTRLLSTELDLETKSKAQRLAHQRVGQLEIKLDLEEEGQGIPHLSDRPDVSEFLSRIERAVGLSGIACDNVEVPAGKDRTQQMYQVKGTGTAGEIAIFLALLEEDRRLPVMDRLRVYSTSEDEVCFEVEMVLFHKTGVQPR